MLSKHCLPYVTNTSFYYLYSVIYSIIIGLKNVYVNIIYIEIQKIWPIKPFILTYTFALFVIPSRCRNSKALLLLDSRVHGMAIEIGKSFGMINAIKNSN